MHTLRRLRAEIISAAVALSVPVQKAVQIADSVEDNLGQAEAEKELTRQERNARIRAEWNGRNGKELMEKYRVSRPSLYRILGATDGG